MSMETTKSIAESLLAGGDFDGWRLPQGWTAESADTLPNCIMIGNDEAWRVWVTVDLSGRSFGNGYNRPRHVRGETERFSGRGWRLKLMEAAEKQLRSIG